MQLYPVKATEISTGMKIRHDPNPKEKVTTVSKYTGECQKGIHFGNDCFDKISTWWAE